MYYDYKPTKYFWEFIKIIQKMSVFLFLFVFDFNKNLMSISILSINIIYLWLAIKHKPYRTYKLNKIDQNSILICITNVALALIYFTI